MTQPNTLGRLQHIPRPPRLTNADLAAARRRGAAADRTEPRAAAARYDPASGRVTVDPTNGCSFAFPARALQGLAEAADPAVEVIGKGLGLHWEPLDADFTVPGLLVGHFGGAARLAREQARRAGSATSPAKAQAARENGRKGGGRGGVCGLAQPDGDLLLPCKAGEGHHEVVEGALPACGANLFGRRATENLIGGRLRTRTCAPLRLRLQRLFKPPQARVDCGWLTTPTVENMATCRVSSWSPF